MIFERMNSYAIFRMTETIRVMVFVVAAMIAFNFYPITASLIILIALFNDVPIMTIAYDDARLTPNQSAGTCAACSIDLLRTRHDRRNRNLGLLVIAKNGSTRPGPAPDPNLPQARDRRAPDAVRRRTRGAVL